MVSKKPSQNEAEVYDFVRAALSSLPIALEGLVIDGETQPHNPDTFDTVLELFGADDRDHLEHQEPCPMLPATCAPQARILSGRSFAKEYDRPKHRTLFVMIPLLSKDARTGLLIVQYEEATGALATAEDHWVYMKKDSGNEWQRRPVPQQLKEVLYLTDRTGG